MAFDFRKNHPRPVLLTKYRQAFLKSHPNLRLATGVASPGLRSIMGGTFRDGSSSSCFEHATESRAFTDGAASVAKEEEVRMVVGRDAFLAAVLFTGLTRT